MKRVVHTGLPEFGRPTEHAVMADGHLRTTAVPLKMDGTFETGDARSQIALALGNLEKTVKAAGVPVLNEEWTKRFKPPYPNRGILIVNAIGVPGIVILIQVHAYIEP